ncbi:MAG: DUF4194 domain-containing protein [Anaerolineales bacterium]|nr:DUF4194 domain-containing protein [Anaerolineales bacterium]
MAEFGSAYEALPPGEQALFAETMRRLFTDGFLWRDDEADRQPYNFLRRRGELVTAYLEVSGWNLRYDEPTRIYCLTHAEGAHRRHFNKKTTIWLLLLRLLYAEKREKPEASLTRQPVVTVGSLIERYAAFFPDQRVRERTSLDEALRALQAARLIRATSRSGLRAAEPDGQMELLPVLQVIIPAQEIAALAERLQAYGSSAGDDAEPTVDA